MLRTLVAASLASLALGAPAGGIPKIVGGEEASPPFKYPWLANLMFGGRLLCGGTLVAPDWVMTAAHCTYEVTMGFVTVQLHRHDLTKTLEQEEAVESEVEFPVIHPRYDPLMIRNDVALWKLKTPVQGIAPINITDTDPNTLPEGTLFRIAGWGAIDYDTQELPDTLMEASLPLWEFDSCNEFWNSLLSPSVQLCAAKFSGGVDTCQGDSGGPLFTVTADGAVQHGVVSFGSGCGDPQSPGVYANLYGLRSFVDAAMEPGRVFDSCASNPCPSDHDCIESIDTYYCASSSALLPSGLVVLLLTVASFFKL